MDEDSVIIVRGREVINEPIEPLLKRYGSDFVRTGKNGEFNVIYRAPSSLLVVAYAFDRNLRAYFASNEQARAIGAFANFVTETGVKLRQPADWQIDMDVDLIARLFRIAKKRGISVFQEDSDLLSQLKESKHQFQ